MKVIMNLWMYGNYFLCSGIKKKKLGIQGSLSSPVLAENLKLPTKLIMEYEGKFLQDSCCLKNSPCITAV